MLYSGWNRSAGRVVWLALVILILISSLVCLKNLRTLYDQHQKFKRLQTYDKFVNEVTDLMDRVELSANKSNLSLKQLQIFLEQQRPKTKLSWQKQNISSDSSNTKPRAKILPR